MNHFPLKLTAEDIVEKIPLFVMQSNQSLKAFTNTYGSGYVKFNEMTITSNRSSAFDGFFFYIKDVKKDTFWTSGLCPSKVIPESYEVSYDNKKLTFLRREHDIETRTEIVVSPKENALIHKVSLRNLSSERRELEVTSYLDPVLLDDNRKDLDHQAFHNLFVQSKFDRDLGGLLFTRRTFNAKSQPPALFHKVFASEHVIKSIQFETNRQNFIGRLRNLDYPIAMDQPLSNFEGDVLDPGGALRVDISLSSNETIDLYFITIIDPFVDNVLRCAARCNTYESVVSLFFGALNTENSLMTELQLYPDKVLLYQRIGSFMMTGNLHTDFQKAELEPNTGHVDSLWKNSISGDYPILLVRLDNLYFNELIEDVVRCHEYLSRSGYEFDLALLNETSDASIVQKVKDQISQLGFESKLGKSKGVFVLDGQTMDPKDTLYLKHFAQLSVSSSNFNVVLSND
jgi:cyclic beta-1,2-glucan synthetase